MPELDERQQRAVDAGPRDLFIAAGAGSGKTRVLTARFVAAVLGIEPYEPTDPQSLLTVTYTEKAAGELSERMRRGLIDAGRPDAARRVSEAWISTIHGMCSRIIRRHALDIGIDPRFTVFDEVESSIMETDALDRTLGELIGTDPDVADMVSALSFATVASAVRSARADLLAAGLDLDDLVAMDSGEVDGYLRELSREAGTLAEEFMRLGSTKTTIGNAQSARQLASALKGMTGSDVATADALAGISFRQQRSVEGHEELVDQAKSLLERARMCGAQRNVARFEEAFIRVLRCFAATYAEEKRLRGALDFEDLQTLTARLLRQRTDIAERYRGQFSMVMVDEFQDTNALQLSIVQQLADGDLCTVGDENQSIYSFRHADVEVFRAHGRSVEERVELDINYRIAGPLLDAINGLFSHQALLGDAYMTLRSPAMPQERPLWPQELPRFSVRFVDTVAAELETQEVEAAAIAERVADHVRLGIDPGDIAVLLGALSRGQGAAVERELNRRGIPASLAAGGAYFECSEVHEVRALLRLIDNVRDDHALLTVLAGRITSLSPDALYAIRIHVELAHAEPRPEGAPRQRLSLWEALHRALDTLTDPERTAAERLIAAVDTARSLHGIRPLGETMMETLLELDYDLTLFNEGGRGTRAWANVMKLARLADEFESAGSGGLGGFIRHLDLRESHARGEQEAALDAVSDAVRIMSIHASKGLEFPVVIVGSLTSDSAAPPIGLVRADKKMLLGMVLPAQDGNEKTIAWRSVADAKARVRDAERKRLFYVACTRAREGLTVVCRTRSDRGADASIAGILRSVFGMADPHTLAGREFSSGTGTISVSVVEDAGTSDRLESPGTPASPRARAVRTDGEVAGTAEAVATTVQAGTPLANVPPVSYTALATYERCPYHYHLTRVARLPLPARPGAPDALEFGSALHLILQRASDTEDIGPIVAAACASTGLDPARRSALHEAAAAFLHSPLADRIRASERVEHEAPFLVPVEGTVLSGAIDVIAWQDAHALIVDYKTGAGPLGPDDARDRYRLQAECYALAALHAGASSVEAVFAEVERGREIAFTFTDADLDTLRERIADPIRGIVLGRFEPIDQYVRGLCDTCPGFGGLCPVTRPPAGASA